jgi:hypothetical protein
MGRGFEGSKWVGDELKERTGEKRVWTWRRNVCEVGTCPPDIISLVRC